MPRNILLLLVLLALLGGCAPPSGKEQAVRDVDAPTLLAEAGTLPGAVVLSDTPARISYPDLSLFGAGAVLPLVGSQELLDPLAEFLKRQGGWTWEAIVRADSEHGAEHARTLADGRARLLENYLTSRGVVSGTVRFEPQAAEGPQLELRVLNAQ